MMALPALTLKVLATDRARDVAWTLDFVEKKRIIVFIVFIAGATIIVVGGVRLVQAEEVLGPECSGTRLEGAFE